MDDLDDIQSESCHLPGAALSRREADFKLMREAKLLRREACWDERGRNAKTLSKHSDFRVVLMVLKAGIDMDKHHIAGRTSIQVVKGRIRLRGPAGRIQMKRGQLTILDEGVNHHIEAEKNSVLLLTMSWHTPAATV